MYFCLLLFTGNVSLSKVQFLILDEADRMLDMGFEPQVRKIVQRSNMPGPGNRQTLMFSATFPPPMQKLAGEFMKDYIWVGVGRVGSTVRTCFLLVDCVSYVHGKDTD